MENAVSDAQTDPGATGATATFARLRILATTDLHMNLMSFDYCADRPDPTVGLTRTASLISDARLEAEGSGTTVVLLDNGDALQGSAMGDFAAGRPGEALHPMMRAFAHLRYDAIGLGNHDFNFGLDMLERISARAPCPVVCTNLRPTEPSQLKHIQFCAILDRDLARGDALLPIRIGVLSVLPPQTLKWDSHLLNGRIQIEDMVAAAERVEKELRENGCDLVILLAHSGLGHPEPSPESENVVIKLAGTRKFDAIVAGHTHRLFPESKDLCLDEVDAKTGTIHDTPVVMAGASGSHLGVIDLTLRRTAQFGWKTSGHLCEVRPIVCRSKEGHVRELSREAADLADLLQCDHNETRRFARESIGHVPKPLHSYFSFFAPDSSLAFVAAAQAAAIRERMANTEFADFPLLSAVAPGRFGGLSGPDAYTDIPAGPVLLRHLLDLQTFPNDLCAAVLTGDQVLDWLEMPASIFNQIKPGTQGDCLVDPAMPGHMFDVLFGLSYVIDPSLPARFGPDGDLRNPDSRRVSFVELRGMPIEPEREFLVALNSYRANGGGNVPALKTARHLPFPRAPIRDVLKNCLKDPAHDDTSEDFPPAWRFAGLPGTVVSVKTGPGAKQYMDELSGRGVVCHGLNDRGFLQLSLSL